MNPNIYAAISILKYQVITSMPNMANLVKKAAIEKFCFFLPLSVKNMLKTKGKTSKPLNMTLASQADGSKRIVWR